MDGIGKRTPQHVMVLGCGRSGTSILGELFDGLDRYAYESEPPFEAVMSADFAQPRAYKVPHASPAYPPPPGLSFPIEAFAARAPDARYFWIVRHPLDAICSLRVGIAKDWGHHPRPPDWCDWLDRPLLEQCARHWSFLNSVGFAKVEAFAEVIRFEEMITEPLAKATAICRSVGVDPATNAAALTRWAARVQDTNNGDFIEAMTSRAYSRPDHAVRVGRWRENLSRKEAEAVWPIVAEAAQRFGYTLA